MRRAAPRHPAGARRRAHRAGLARARPRRRARAAAAHRAGRVRAAATNGSAPSCSPAPTRRAPSPIIRAARSSRRCRRSPSAAAPPRPRAPWAFATVHSADGDKDDLVALLRADLVRTKSDAHGAPLLYLAGEDRAGDLARRSAALPVCTAVVYRAVKAERFPPTVAAALAQGAIDGVLHFSRRSAEAYLDCAARAGIARSRRSRRCIIVSPARWRRRSPPPAPPRCGSRPGPTRRRCWISSGRGEGADVAAVALGLLPPPLWGRGGEAGSSRLRQAVPAEDRAPPPPTPPHKGEGSAAYAATLRIPLAPHPGYMEEPGAG